MHRNARLTPAGRLLLCQRIEAGWPVAHAAESMGISRDRAYVWWRRYRAEGVAGLEDRSSRPHRSPMRTKPSRERRIIQLRRQRGLGPARIAGIVKVPASTVHAVLVRHGLNRLDYLDRATRVPIRRMEMSRPGELVHVDIKKLGRIPRGGGWRIHGRGARPNSHAAKKAAIGYAFVHSAVDAYSRLAYSEVLDDEQGATAAGFWLRAAVFFAAHGITVERVLTDNGSCYRSRQFTAVLSGIMHSRTRPYRPATNGKVERFNRTLLAEWAYARAWSSDGQRTRALTAWLHLYNHHRHHTAIGGAPITRVSNLTGHYN
ncbi:MAG TPA: IS481 family transposase [Jatrophihabitantaceae bacterium]|nr:IS481 family transposase [Jatrophihabitantaceae bacterium]